MDDPDSNVVRFPVKGYPIDARRHQLAPSEPAPWALMTIERERRGSEVRFSVCAWSGPPSDPSSDRLFVGGAATRLEASNLARVVGKELGVAEFVDFCGGSDDEPDFDGAA